MSAATKPSSAVAGAAEAPPSTIVALLFPCDDFSIAPGGVWAVLLATEATRSRLAARSAFAPAFAMSDVGSRVGGGTADGAGGFAATGVSERNSSRAASVSGAFFVEWLRLGNNKAAPTAAIARTHRTHANLGRRAARNLNDPPSAPGFGARRATSPCNIRRVAGCNSSGGPASSRRLFAQSRSRFSIGRSGSMHVCYPLDGKTPDFSPENVLRRRASSRSRHLLRRELTVFGFNFNVPLSSS